MPEAKITRLNEKIATLRQEIHVLAYNMKRVISILGVAGLMEAIRA